MKVDPDQDPDRGRDVRQVFLVVTGDQRANAVRSPTNEHARGTVTGDHPAFDCGHHVAEPASSRRTAHAQPARSHRRPGRPPPMSNRGPSPRRRATQRHAGARRSCHRAVSPRRGGHADLEAVRCVPCLAPCGRCGQRGSRAAGSEQRDSRASDVALCTRAAPIPSGDLDQMRSSRCATTKSR